MPSLTASSQPGTIHDFSGFPKALYELTYDAPGAPEVAERISMSTEIALAETPEDIAATWPVMHQLRPHLDAERGRDHGAWVPATLAWPAGEIPLIQLSLLRGKSTREHIALAKPLRPCATKAC